MQENSLSTLKPALAKKELETSSLQEKEINHCIVFAKMLTFLSSRQKIEQDLDKSSVLSFLVIHDNTIIATS